MMAYYYFICAAVTFLPLCMCIQEITPTFQLEVPPIMTENSTFSVQCNASDETSSTSDYRIRVHIDNEELNHQILGQSSSGIAATSDEKIWTRYDNGKEIHCCIQHEESSGWYQECSPGQILNITFPPSYIQLEEVQMNNTEDDVQDLILKCLTDVSNPLTKFSWIGLTSTMSTKLKSIPTYNNQTSSFAAAETLFMNLSRQDIGLTIYCQATNSGWPGVDLFASYTINVTLSPDVTIIGDAMQIVRRGSSVSFRCLVDSNPLPHIAWYNDTAILIESKDRDYLDLELVDVTLDHNGSVFTCSGQNAVGIGTNQSMTLIVEDLQVVAEDDDFLSSLGIGPVISIVIISVNIVVVIIVIVIFVRCRKKQRAKQILNEEGQDEDAGDPNEGIEESNTVTIEEDVVVYARVNKPPPAPVAGPGLSEVPVGASRCGNVPVALPRTDEPPVIPPRTESVHGSESGYGNVPVAEQSCGNMPEVEQDCDNIPETGPESDNVLTLDADIEDDPQYRESFEVSERHYENVDNEELGSLAERNIIPPPYDAETEDIDEEQDNAQEPQTKQPNTLIYADVEFPGCSRETSTIIGHDPTVYSSVVFDNTQVHSIDNTNDE